MEGKWLKQGLLLTVVCGAVYAGGVMRQVFAQDVVQGKKAPESGMDELKNQLNRMEEAFLVQQKMMKQMEALALSQQEQIKELKKRIDAQSEKPVVVAKEEIKQEVQQEVQQTVKQEVGNYLESKEGREKLGLGMPGKYAPVYAYYMPDKEKATLGFQTQDGNYSLNVGFRAQLRATYRDRDADFHENDITDIRFRRSRICFAGNIYSKDLYYNVEIAGDNYNVTMWDYCMWWMPSAADGAFGIKGGYFKVPANRQWNSAAFKLLLQDRSIASDAFSQNRDYGLDFYGKPFDGHMEYHAAVFRGAGQNPNPNQNIDNELMYVVTARYYPFGWYNSYNIATGWDETDLKYEENFKAVIGASAIYGAKVNEVKLAKTDTSIGNFDVGVRYRGFTWDSEFYIRKIHPESGAESTTADGFYTQAGYFVLPKKLEIAARYSWLDPNTDVRYDIQKEYTVGINYYFRGHRQQIQGDVGHYETDTNTGEKVENRIRLQYQIVF